jgi:hypothetical protein
LVIYAIGKVAYTDAFNFQHRTTFCAASEPDTLDRLRFRQCPEYNEIDPNEQ